MAEILSLPTGSVSGLPISSGLPLLFETVGPTFLSGASQLELVLPNLVNAWSPQLVSLSIATGASGATPTSFSFPANVPTLTPGQPFTLFSSLPQPGSIIQLADNAKSGGFGGSSIPNAPAVPNEAKKGSKKEASIEHQSPNSTASAIQASKSIGSGQSTIGTLQPANELQSTGTRRTLGGRQITSPTLPTSLPTSVPTGASPPTSLPSSVSTPSIGTATPTSNISGGSTSGGSSSSGSTSGGNAPSIVSTPSSVSVPSIVSTPTSVSAPSIVSTPTSVSAPSVVSTPTSVSAPSIVSTPTSVSIPSIISTPTSASVPSIVSTPTSVSIPTGGTSIVSSPSEGTPTDSTPTIGTPTISTPTVSTPSIGTPTITTPTLPTSLPTSLPTGALPTGNSNSSSGSGAFSGVGSSTMYTIPEGAFVTGQWQFQYSDDGKTWNIATAAASSRDLSGQYLVVNGSEFDMVSGSSQFVFFPPDIAVYPTSTRQVVACLTATMFIPGSAKPASSTNCLGTIVNSWSSVTGTAASGNTLPTVTAGSVPTSVPPEVAALVNSFQNMFTITIDTNAPQPGNPVNLQVLPFDTTTLLAPQVDSILDDNPDLHLTAAIEIGAPLTSIINSFTNDIVSLFSPGSGARGVANSLAQGALTVSNVLTGALSIPIAVDLQGRRISKTLKPAIGQNTLPNLNQVPALSMLSGALPIGSLTSTITSLAQDISISLPKTSGTQPSGYIPPYWITNVLNGVHGVGLNFFPLFVTPGTPSAAPTSFEVAISPSILFPGSTQALVQPIVLGTINIILPTITIPQVGFFFHDQFYQSFTGPDTLVAVDPITWQVVNTASGVSAMLSTLSLLLTQIRTIFPASVLTNLQPYSFTFFSEELDELISTVSALNGFATNTANLRVINAHGPGDQPYQLNTFNGWYSSSPTVGYGVSSVIWMGYVPTGRPSWVMYIGLASSENPPVNSTLQTQVNAPMVFFVSGEGVTYDEQYPTGFISGISQYSDNLYYAQGGVSDITSSALPLDPAIPFDNQATEIGFWYVNDWGSGIVANYKARRM